MDDDEDPEDDASPEKKGPGDSRKMSGNLAHNFEE